MADIPSKFGVVSVQTVPIQNVGPFYTSPAEAPMRVLVRNLGGAAIFLATDSAALNGLQVTSDRFELPAGTSDVFVVQPRQALFAVAQGANARLCYAASVALPIQGI